MNENNNANLIRDILGVTALAVTVFALLALTSFNPADPSFNHRFSGEGSVLNQGGVVGAYSADGLVQAFGSGAFLFPMITLGLGWTLVRGNQFHRLPIILGSSVLFLLCACALVAVHFNVDPYFKTAGPSGGLTGILIGGTLVLWLNKIGASVLLGTLSFLSLLAMANLSVNQLIEGFTGLIRGTLRLVANCGAAVVALYQKLQARREQAFDERPVFAPSVEKSAPVIIAGIPEPTAKNQEKKETPAFPVQEDFPFLKGVEDYQIPPLSLLNDPPPRIDDEKLREDILLSSAILEKKLADFGVDGRVVQVLPGPVITLYEFEPAPGVKVSRILALTDDLALAMRAPSVRFLAPVPGKPVVGIEIPNPKRETVYFKDVISSDLFQESHAKLPLVIGKDHVGLPAVQDLSLVPHLLIAGATGSGKSVGVNAMICSLLLNSSPEDVKMIMIDPKMLELSMFDGIPHLISPVVTNPKKAAAALQWAVQEMERRYKAMAEKGVRNISGYNQMVDRVRKEMEAEAKNNANTIKLPNKLDDEEEDYFEEEEAEEIPTRLPYIVIVIDELADLMMVASKGVEDALARLAQMARASGIHLIVATQRPSVDVLTGLIKANFPARISYQVTSRVDSRTILDCIGAERLLGKGDMLFMPPGTSKLQRIHGAMVSDEEINRVLKFIKSQKKADYEQEDFQAVAEDNQASVGDDEFDEKYDEALALVAREQQASISMVQRRLRVGYNRAARMIEIMEREGVVGPSDGVKPREVYVKPVAID